VVNGTEVTVHFKLKLLNVDEGEATNSDTGGTAVPHKTTISRNISAEFQEMLPDIQIHAIHKRKKKP
jgi:hypothetical protein